MPNQDETYGGAYSGAQIDQAIGAYLSGSAGGDTPIGTVISFFGTKAPPGYLICDGAEYNIEDYPQLSAFFIEQFGSINYCGGDGTTTFAVPDMRNLFLRGYHGEAAEQLSGEVGVKQEATKIPWLRPSTVDIKLFSTGEALRTAKNTDTLTDLSDNYDLVNWISKKITGYTNYSYYTSRPVNMAVLYCIKANF